MDMATANPTPSAPRLRKSLESNLGMPKRTVMVVTMAAAARPETSVEISAHCHAVHQCMVISMTAAAMVLTRLVSRLIRAVNRIFSNVWKTRLDSIVSWEKTQLPMAASNTSAALAGFNKRGPSRSSATTRPPPTTEVTTRILPQ